MSALYKWLVMGENANEEASKKKPLELNIDLSGSVPSKIPDRIRRQIRCLRDYVRRRDREPLVGLEYILEYRVQTLPGRYLLKYFCEVCDLNCELVPMIEHLGGSRHRRCYFAKEFPYLMNLTPHPTEDKNQYLRRMALEIEQELGLKDFKVDRILRTVSIMNVKTTEARLAKRNSRWEKEYDRPVRMRKAQEYLDSIEIADDDEQNRAEKLAEQLMTLVRDYNKKINNETLFPMKVAKAKDVAKSIMEKVHQEKRPKPLRIPGPPVLPRPLPMTGTLPMASTHLGALPMSGPLPLPLPMTGPLPLPVSVPLHFPVPPVTMAPVPVMAPLPPPAQTDSSEDDLKFFKKLQALLAAISEDALPGEVSAHHSKLLMLKQIFDKKGLSLTSGADASLKQKLLTLLGSEGVSDTPPNQAPANQNAPRNVPEPGSFGDSAMMPMSRFPDPDPFSLPMDRRGLHPDLTRDSGLRRPLHPEWPEREMAGRYGKRLRVPEEEDFFRRRDDEK